MTKRILIDEARARGYTIDKHCYPPVAYKGARFKPTAIEHTFTPLEEEMFLALKLANTFFDSLPEGWLGRTTGDIGALNDFYIKTGKIIKEVS